MLAIVAVAVAFAAVLARGRPQLIGDLDRGLAAPAALLSLYAVSLLLLAGVASIGGGDLHTRFQRGELCSCSTSRTSRRSHVRAALWSSASACSSAASSCSG